MIARGLAVAAALAALAAPAALAAGEAPVGKATRLDDHSMRVLVKAPGDLLAADVQASFGGRPALVDRVARQGKDRPLDLVFALDVSGSMRGEPIAAAVDAGRALLTAVGRNDRVGLVTFSAAARVAAPLTGDVTAVQAALDTAATGQGTALYDGIATALTLGGERPDARRVVVVLSDGADTGSQRTLAALRRAVAGSDVELNAVGLSESQAFTSGPLEALTGATGGTYVSADAAADLGPITAALTQSRLASTFAVDLLLPEATGQKVAIAVRGSDAREVALPAGVSGRQPPPLERFGGPVIAVLGALAVLLLGVALTGHAKRQTLGSRLAPYTATVRDRRGQSTPDSALIDMLYETIEKRLEGRRVWKVVEQLREQAGVRWPTPQLLLLMAGGGLVLFLVGAVLLGLPGAPLGLALGAGGPLWLLRFKARRRQRAFEAQLPELMGVLSSALRAGRSFSQSLDTIVEEAEEPAHSEFKRAQQQVRLGVPVEQALDEMSRRLHSDSFELVVLTVDVQRRIGGNIAEIFDQVADTVRKRHQFTARVRALTAMGAMSAYVLLGLPFVMGFILWLMNRAYMDPLFHSSTGRLLLVIGITLMGIGSLVLRRIVRPRAIA